MRNDELQKADLMMSEILLLGSGVALLVAFVIVIVAVTSAAAIQ